MDARQFADGLRQIADWYEANPDVALPYQKRLDVFGEEDTKSRMAEICRRLGGTVTKAPVEDSGLFEFSRSFNGVALRFVVDRATVCTARVVGQRTIPAQPATPERSEDVLEWDCSPVLADG